MMKHIIRVVLTILALTLHAWSAVIHERRDIHPRYWHDQQPLDGKTVLPVRIGLTQSNLEKAEALLRDVSDPSSSKYGKHLSKDEVDNLFAPSQETVNVIRNWLEESGIAGHRIEQSANKQWLQFNATSDELGSLLNTQYYSYQHALTGKSYIAAREYSVPSNVSAHIDYIVPGVKHLSAKKRPLAAASMERDNPIPDSLNFPWPNVETNTSMCSTVMTPACVRALYNIPIGSKAAKGNELGIVAQLDAYSQEDFDDFKSLVAPDLPEDAKPDVKSINGGVAPVPAAEAGIESNLDLMTAAPIIWPQKATIFQVDDPIYQADYAYPGFLNNFLDAVDGSYCDKHDTSFDPPYPNPKENGYKGKKQCGVYEPTKIITISYANSEDNLPPSYQTRQCYEWLKLGLQGITVIAASGDTGVQSGSDQKEGCLNNGKAFAPQFRCVMSICNNSWINCVTKGR
ncbi:protease S8 tripeptidyl peptidase I (cln2) [Ascosphaera apis ARSEF 7405]|uniref:Protease S8 tripeptidyl peptidase I (Cln2) n=1 Tax=Ascosphaera apis ARSEF 7405 TaxID=392613 RepID=A0A168BTY2_9EURO|nr:protease S8 tripeptidyl peptidase I (cln2) [Ascosphaera apis ARSEF 7405]